MDDAANFERDISDYCDRAGQQAKVFVIALTQNLISYIQDRTPVRTGRLRASIGATRPLSEWEPGQPIVIGSGLDYAARVEYGFNGTDSLGRHYHQRGAGMFTQAENAFDQIAEETARQVGLGSGDPTDWGLGDVAEEVADIAMGGAYEAAYASMGTAASGAAAYAESMASIAEAAAEFGIIL